MQNTKYKFKIQNTIAKYRTQNKKTPKNAIGQTSLTDTDQTKVT